MKTVQRKEGFICPECGSREVLELNRSEIAKLGPGGGARRAAFCARCRFEIPMHLGERWGISAEEAVKEWRQVYRGVTRRLSAGEPERSPMGAR